MAENIMDRLARALRGEDTQDIQIPFAPEAQEDAQLAQINEEATSPNMMTKPELAQKEVQQELEKTPMGQAKEQMEASQVSNPVKAAAKAQEGNKPFSIEDLLAKRNQLDEKYQGDIKAARESDANKAMLANLVKSLGNLGAAEVQRKVGTQVGLKDFQPVQGPDTAGQLEKDRQSRLSKLKEDMGILASLQKSKQAGQLTPYQQMALELQQKRLDLLGGKEDRLQRKDVFQEGLKERLSDKEVKDVNTFDDGIRILDDIETMLQKPSVKENLGPYASRAEEYSSLVPGVERDPDFVKTQQMVGIQLADYVKSISGAQVSEQEAQRLLKNIPNMTDKPGEFKVKLDTFRKELTEAKDQYVGNIGRQKSGAEKFKGSEKSDKVDVVLPNGQRGRINRDKVEAFKKKYPDAQVME